MLKCQIIIFVYDKMPYTIKKVNNEYQLILDKNKKVLGTHKSKKEAQKQISAIEISKIKRKLGVS